MHICDFVLIEGKRELSCKDVFKSKGVFSALDFAFRNPEALSIDEDSAVYRDIQRAYWQMPFDWCMERQRECSPTSHD